MEGGGGVQLSAGSGLQGSFGTGLCSCLTPLWRPGDSGDLTTSVVFTANLRGRRPTGGAEERPPKREATLAKRGAFLKCHCCDRAFVSRLGRLPSAVSSHAPRVTAEARRL